MAGMKRNRIEPTLGDDKPEQDEDEIRIDRNDRVSTRGKLAKRRIESFDEDEDDDEDEPPRRRRRRAVKRRSSGGVIGLFRRFVYWCLVMGLWGAIAGGGLVAYFAAQMPSASTWTVPARAPNIKIVDADGSLIANRGATGGEALSIDEMSPYLPEAIVAIEDRRFYHHFGVDFIGVGRAFVTNIIEGHKAQGASTITQQLARNLFLSPKKTFERKVQEVLLALWLEHKYTKDQILAMYLNRVYFGDGAYGVEAAARHYFNKSARDVNLGEAALLAGLVQSPSRLSPTVNPKGAEDRAKVVLGAMREQGYITDSDFNRAMKQTPDHAKRQTDGAGEYVADMVMGQLKGLIGDVKQDIVVTTTIDPTMEKEAEDAIRTTIDKNGTKYHVSQGALVSVDATGAVKALVGGRDYSTSQYNRAAVAKRQPGSSFKPFLYAAAMEQGDTPESIRNDAPVKIGNWTPENDNKKYNGPVTLAYALANSLNTIAAQLVMEVGPDRVVKMAHRMGIDSDIQPNASIALGTSEVTLMELTSAYAPFMNGGYKATPHFISQITDTSGKVLYKADFSDPPRVLSPEVVSEMTRMMEGVITSGTGKAARLKDWQAAGKTGTTQSMRDALFIGFTGTLTTGVWFGNDDNSPMKNVFGGTLPARTWKDFMTAALKGTTPVPLIGDPHAGQGSDGSLTSMIERVLKGSDSNGQADDNAYPPAPPPPGVPMGQAEPVQGAVNQGNGNTALPGVPTQPGAVLAPGGEAAVPQGQYPQGQGQQGQAQQLQGQQGQYPQGNGPQQGPYNAAPSPNAPPAGDGFTPPADIGQQGNPPPQGGNKTTLLDIIMGR
ncbi:penicillin-binding protein [Allorhizobium sp. BGMRC 0089]|uniref:transglycosylase domain-containing protein n=1 Tax=Allorhizobium sonneratiae TaxID=2934936 RepID=UPI002034481E|nr:transglycosylase domain-containing protein [Allorhizobium sonneratiae]MCM2291664.1 penicillin-binding protein [Allorhizobium sonneratiae]